MDTFYIVDRRARPMNEMTDIRFRNERREAKTIISAIKKKKKKSTRIFTNPVFTRLAKKQKKKCKLLNVLVNDCKEIITLVALGIN